MSGPVWLGGTGCAKWNRPRARIVSKKEAFVLPESEILFGFLSANNTQGFCGHFWELNSPSIRLNLPNLWFSREKWKGNSRAAWVIRLSWDVLFWLVCLKTFKCWYWAWPPRILRLCTLLDVRRGYLARNSKNDLSLSSSISFPFWFVGNLVYWTTQWSVWLTCIAVCAMISGKANADVSGRPSSLETDAVSAGIWRADVGWGLTKCSSIPSLASALKAICCQFTVTTIFARIRCAFVWRNFTQFSCVVILTAASSIFWNAVSIDTTMAEGTNVNVYLTQLSNVLCCA